MLVWGYIVPIDGENHPLIVNILVEFEKSPVEVKKAPTDLEASIEYVARINEGKTGGFATCNQPARVGNTHIDF